jgi:hypothetical protein
MKMTEIERTFEDARIQFRDAIDNARMVRTKLIEESENYPVLGYLASVMEDMILDAESFYEYSIKEHNRRMESE